MRLFSIKVEQLEQNGYELCKFHGSNTNTKCGLYKKLWMDSLVLMTWMKI